MIRRIGFVLAGLLLFQRSYRQIRSFLFSYRGKIVVISGGSRGLGLVLARQLIQQGARVAVLARDYEVLQEAAKEFDSSDFFAVTCDVGRSTDVKAAVEEVVAHYGKVDILIHNAGVIQVGPRENQAVKDYQESLKTHFWGAFYLIENLLPIIKNSDQPRILVVDSIGGLFGVPHLASYCAGKSALAGYIQSIQAELRQEGIGVTLAYPGLMRTGSPYQAIFKGEAFLERRWFTLFDSLPLMSVSAESSARQLLQALAERRAIIVVGMLAKVASIISGLMPNLFSHLSAGLLLIQPATGKGKQGQKGYELGQDESLEKVAVLTNLAALKNNEL